MASPYELFGTDAKSEKDGIILDYGAFWLRIARAGGANKKFARVLDAKLQPYRRQLQAGTMEDELANRLMAEAYAEAIVLAWGSTEHGDGKMIGRDGEAIEFSRENVIRLLLDLPDLFADIQNQAGRVANFRAAQIEDAAGN